MATNDYMKISKDAFSCIQVNTSKLPKMTDEEMSEKLAVSLPQWREDGVRGVWGRVGIQDSHHVPVFVKHGFEFHHAQPGYVMLKRWLPETEPDTLPPYANQYLGAAGFVVNSDNQLLVIQERYHKTPHWKLPGGHADLGEEVSEAAVREVFEETGVRAEFRCVIAFRHMHRYRYGCSDFYFICLLRPVTTEISKCDREIAEAKWIDLAEYIAHPSVSAANRHFAECYLKMVKEGRFALKPSKILNYSKTGTNLVYSIQDTEFCEDSPETNEGNT